MLDLIILLLVCLLFVWNILVPRTAAFCCVHVLYYEISRHLTKYFKFMKTEIFPPYLNYLNLKLSSRIEVSKYVI